MNRYYNVRPRYSPGSPAMVDERIATMVAADERRGHEIALAGGYGIDKQQRAADDTLRGLSEHVEERADCWIVTDLITKERFVRPFTRYGESPRSEGQRMQRLRERYGLPLEQEMK